MTNKEMVSEILGKYGAMTSKQIAVQLNIKMGVILTPSQVAGALRSLVVRGHAANSKDEHRHTKYWLTNEGVQLIRGG